MASMTLSTILDDLRVADAVLRKFEQSYWLSSEIFYNLYARGVLDDGEHLEDFAEWAGFYKIKQHREAVLRQFSEQRVSRLRAGGTNAFVRLAPEEPLIEVAA